MYYGNLYLRGAVELMNETEITIGKGKTHQGWNWRCSFGVVKLPVRFSGLRSGLGGRLSQGVRQQWSVPAQSLDAAGTKLYYNKDQRPIIS